jgi:hypothetical protein
MILFIYLFIYLTGALSKEDIALLSTGYICLLPRDGNGRDVVCHDATRKPPGMLDHRMRVFFYIGNMLAENYKNQTEGSRMLMIINKITMDGGFAKTMELAKDVLPTVNFDVHIIHVPGESNKTNFIDKLVPAMLKILGSFLEEKTKVHANETKSALIEHLESDGFKRSGLPTSVGGTWTYDQFYYWQEARVRVEWELPLSVAQRKLIFDGDKYTCRGLSELNEGEKVERKRRLNLLHSRRKREKERVEVEILRSQVERLENEKHEAEVERDRLEYFLSRAMELVQVPRQNLGIEAALSLSFAIPTSSQAPHASYFHQVLPRPSVPGVAAEAHSANLSGVQRLERLSFQSSIHGAIPPSPFSGIYTNHPTTGVVMQPHQRMQHDRGNHVQMDPSIWQTFQYSQDDGTKRRRL